MDQSLISKHFISQTVRYLISRKGYRKKNEKLDCSFSSQLKFAQNTSSDTKGRRCTSTDEANGKYSTFKLKLHRLDKQQSLAVQKQIVWVPCGWTRGDTTRNTWKRSLERVLDTVPPLRMTDFHLFQIAVGTSTWSIFDIFINGAVPRKHCNTFGRCSGGIDVHNDFKHLQSGLEFPKLWRKIPTLFLVEAHVSPLQKKTKLQCLYGVKIRS